MPRTYSLETLQDHFYDLSLAEQAEALRSFELLHRMKARQEGVETEGRGRRRRRTAKQQPEQQTLAGTAEGE